MEDWNDYGCPAPDYTTGKPTADTYKSDETADIDWSNPKERTKALTDKPSQCEVVKVGKKYLPKNLARKYKGRVNEG
ncbi:MAG: hypothetical protein ILP11_04765 [Alphaproteobacteria bacterium]|nr:hypothetical protein [Alphaproteobacteria bacterium]